MPESTDKRIIAVMSDLFFSAKINDAAKKLGITVEFVKDKAVVLEKATLKPAMLLIDLNCDSADPLDLIARIKAEPGTRDIAMVGFVSHVRADLKNRAQQSGCDLVVARSAFAQNLDQILARASGPTSGPLRLEAD
jgi:CheY-like chemotaxis protein